MSKKTVLVVGGIHGVGKSTLCKHLQEEEDALVLKQRHILIEIGREISLEWENIGPLHFKFINQVADRIVDRINHHGSDLAVIDCHYAIRSSKALRVKGSNIAELYIPDLDPVVINRIINDHDLRPLMLLAAPEICEERIRIRDQDNHEYESSIEIEGLRLQEVAEIHYFNQLILQFASSISRVAIIHNETTLEQLYTKVHKFIG